MTPIEPDGEQTYYRRRRQYGGMGTTGAHRLKELVADLSLDNALLKDLNHKRVECIWREEGLKVPQKQPKKRRLWLNDGSRLRLRPAYHNHVWSYDFVEDRLTNGRRVRWLNIIYEYSRESRTLCNALTEAGIPKLVKIK